MKLKEFSAESVLVSASKVSIVGISLFLICLIASIFFPESMEVCNYVGLIGAVVFPLPILLMQFLMASGLIGREINILGKAALYFFIFPFAIAWAITSLDSLFNFLPDFTLLMDEGASLDSVWATRQEFMMQLRIVTAIVYGGLIVLGLITRVVIKKLR